MNLKKIFTSIVVHGFVFLFIILMPLLVQAQTQSSSPVCDALFGGSINTFKDIIDYVTCLVIKSIIPLLFVGAIAMFVYGIVQYFLHPDNAKDREKGRQYAVWALIGMFVLFSISGLIEIIRNTFGVTGGGIPLLPETQ